MKIRTRLIMIVIGAILASFIIGVFALYDLRGNLVEDRKTNTRNLVNSTISLLDYYYKQQEAGELSVNEAQNLAKKAVSSLRYDGGNYFWVFTAKEQIMLVHGVVPKLVGQDMSDSKDTAGHFYYRSFDKVIKKQGEGFVNYNFYLPNSKETGPKLAYVKNFQPWGWVVGTGIYVNDIDDIFYQSLAVQGAIALVVIGLVIFFSTIVSKGITGPLSRIIGNMNSVAQGDHDIEIQYTEQESEIGDLARTMEMFRDRSLEVAHMRSEQVENEKRSEESRRHALKQMAIDFEESVGQILADVLQLSAEMQDGLKMISASAKNAGDSLQGVSSVSQHATRNVETVAAAAEQLSASISEISSQVTQSSGIAAKAVEASEGTHKKIEQLANAASEIGEVVALITDIANQTNLLALNATIEAARAGDAGKGFAVVANEVKNLATQTARATDNIRRQVDDIQAATTSSVNAIADIAGTIRELDTSTGRIAAAVEEQGAATQEIARNVDEAARGVGQVNSAIDAVATGAVVDGQRSDKANDLAASLSGKAQELNKAVSSFLSKVRSS
ncbi:cache domain-containing protein [uncultured Thalassospira sp.]|uniref:methyl-accepting chemotaxis protein n=1 Tax=uncultured Thalassospira sp. TaxID=404382 RepID=UPI0030DC2DF5|tara:strand:- start:6396 stop:8072 length:1677 start_codon:yes stop_codon:yes gene_type:complete